MAWHHRKDEKKKTEQTKEKSVYSLPPKKTAVNNKRS